MMTLVRKKKKRGLANPSYLAHLQSKSAKGERKRKEIKKKGTEKEKEKYTFMVQQCCIICVQVEVIKPRLYHPESAGAKRLG